MKRSTFSSRAGRNFGRRLGPSTPVQLQPESLACPSGRRRSPSRRGGQKRPAERKNKIATSTSTSACHEILERPSAFVSSHRAPTCSSPCWRHRPGSGGGLGRPGSAMHSALPPGVAPGRRGLSMLVEKPYRLPMLNTVRVPGRAWTSDRPQELRRSIASRSRRSGVLAGKIWRVGLMSNTAAMKRRPLHVGLVPLITPESVPPRPALTTGPDRLTKFR